MQLLDLLPSYSSHPAVKQLATFLQSSLPTASVHGLQGSAAPMVFAALHAQGRFQSANPVLFILDDEEEAGYFYNDLHRILGEGSVGIFPSSFKRDIKYGQRDLANEILRTEAITQLQKGGLPLLVTTPQALSELVVAKENLSSQIISLSVGQSYSMDQLREQLFALNFQQVDYVYEPGQFAQRGSILDVFSFSSENPYRLDFFGDELDSIRWFDISSQLSIERFPSVEIVNSLSNIHSVRQCFFELLPPDALLVMHRKAYIQDTLSHIYKTGFVEQAMVEHNATHDEQEESLSRERVMAAPETLFALMDTFRQIEWEHTDASDNQIGTHISFHTSVQPIFHKNFDLLFQSLQDYQQRGFQLYILADSDKQNERLKQIFQDSQSGITFTPVQQTLHGGYVDEWLKVCYFTDHQIFDRFHKFNLKSEKAHTGKVALTLKEIRQFQVGDYVVHIDHGIGRFAGLVLVPNGGQMQEMIKIVYNHDDIIFVSIHSLHKVSKYKGKDDQPPRISTLGTGAWNRMKERTKKKIKDIARDLILLYSKRREEKGFAFSPDSFMQYELEASFLYEDTPDQLKATQDIKRDMERPRPMDRLVCGDVGFGKTEVAIRAAFKACADNKQVAVLVPTTVLAFQHYRTFSERLKNMPVRIEYITRARSTKVVSQVLKDLHEGKVNIVIGTHRLLNAQVKFHDLGLLIIDEEQKFGVSTKEKLRQMKAMVDTLTLTATPIPRTLQFSLMGARDLSIIQTPPPNRYPIHTQLCTYSDDVIADAIRFELSRNGQVFIVTHRIAHLPTLVDVIHKTVPEARVVVGHGQMPSDQLEQILLDFANHDYDVLVSTTIIESGIDIPNANTILVNNAQHFGLSDLHQIRGRVGRTNKKAFCYLLAPPLSVLTTEARRRLQAIETYSDLGSGIHIAMQDLDIRGAGNLLGSEQSGFIADLGFETYHKILSEAVQELRSEEFSEQFADEAPSGANVTGDYFVNDCQLESDLQMFFSEQYVPTSTERMLLYRELDSIEREEDIQAFCKRMEDRFGPIPHEGMQLIQVVSLRRLGRLFGVERIVLKNKRMRLYFVPQTENPFYASKAFKQMVQFAIFNASRCKLEELKGHNTLLVQSVQDVSEAVSVLNQMHEIEV